jgi:uncharacterized protein YuzE
MHERPAPYAAYLDDIDILYVRLQDAAIAKMREGASVWVNIDHAADGSVVAVEVVNAKSMGVDLTGVPERETVERLIREAGISLPRPAST